MLCDICKKNPATIHIQEISNGEKKTLHLCQECAEKKASSDSSFNTFNLAEVLYNISNTLQFAGEKNAQEEEDRKEEISKFSGIFCPSCGWDFDHLRKTGRLGCPDCFKTFEEYLKNIIPAMHRGTIHRGKVPPSVMKNPEIGRIVRTTHLAAELERLKNAQQEAIRTEDYEQAAVLRDEIAKIVRKLDDLTSGAEA